MYIHDTNAPTKNLRIPEMPDDADPVDVTESDSVDEGGVAKVKKDVGEALIEHCDTITEHE